MDAISSQKGRIEIWFGQSEFCLTISIDGVDPALGLKKVSGPALVGALSSLSLRNLHGYVPCRENSPVGQDCSTCPTEASLINENCSKPIVAIDKLSGCV